MELYVDEKYRTSLGVSFYNRTREYRLLRELLDVYRTVVVYGPRGVGKSELVRYLVTRENLPAVVVDARAERVKPLAPPSLAEVARHAASILANLLGQEATTLAKLLLALSEHRSLQHLVRGRSLVVVIDEFHQLPGHQNAQEALRSLEAYAALLAKNADETRAVRNLVVTVSEGFIATIDATARLDGYSATLMPVEHMDQEHFTLLHREYSEKKGCKLGPHEILALVGGAPGYLPELCRMTREHLVKHKIPAWLYRLEEALRQAQTRTGMNRRQLLDALYSLFTQAIQPLRHPHLHSLGEALTRSNIVYPCYTPRGVHYRPQLPVYRVAIELAYHEDKESLLDLPPERILEEALDQARSPWQG